MVFFKQLYEKKWQLFHFFICHTQEKGYILYKYNFLFLDFLNF
jgi:hypothetical protein